MHYFNVIVCLFEPFVTSSVSILNAYPIGTESPEAIVAGAKIRFETILRLYYLRHGFDAYDPVMAHHSLLLGFMTIKPLVHTQDLPKRSVAALESTLIFAIKGVRDMAAYSVLAEAMYRLLHDSLDPERKQLLRSISWIGEEKEETEKRRKALISQHVRSQFPINIVSIAEDPEARRVENLIAAYQDIDPEDISESA